MREWGSLQESLREKAGWTVCDPELKFPSNCHLIGTLFGLCHGEVPVPGMLLMASAALKISFSRCISSVPLKRCREPGPESDQGHAPSCDSSMMSTQLQASSGSPPTLEKLTRVMTMKCPRRRPHWRCSGVAHVPSTSVPTEHLPFRSDVHMVLRRKGRREKLGPHRQ